MNMTVLTAAISRSQLLSPRIGVTIAQRNPYAGGDAEIAGSRLKCAVRNAGRRLLAGELWKLIALVLLQLVVEFPVYSDQSLGWDCVEDPQGGCPCEIDISRLPMGLCSCSEWPVLPKLRTMGTAVLSASAASANPYAAIDRPGTCSPYERSGVDSETAAAVPAST
jgi:hypothetical protein